MLNRTLQQNGSKTQWCSSTQPDKHGPLENITCQAPMTLSLQRRTCSDSESPRQHSMRAHSISNPQNSQHLGDGVASTLEGLQSPPVHLTNNCLNAQDLFDCCICVRHAGASCAVDLFPVFSYHLHAFTTAQLWQRHHARRLAMLAGCTCAAGCLSCYAGY